MTARKRAKGPRLLLIQGANMAYLGKRQPELYGTTSAAELDRMLEAHAEREGYGLEIAYFHVEGEAIARIYAAIEKGLDALVINPAGFLYAGYALRDCLRAIPVPTIEVHMTNIEKRGSHSVTAEAAVGYVAGFGLDSYLAGIEMALRLVGAKKRLADGG